jgi:hypothetical protein
MFFRTKGRFFKRFGLLALFFFICLAMLGGLAFSTRPLARAATVYEVGPGKPYAQLSQVASLLQPGDTVNVYANGTTPYHGVELKQPGTSAAPITIHGVRDGSGRRPILSDNGLISGSANIVVAFEAGYYVFDGFEITTSSTDPGQGPVVAFNPFRGPFNTTRDITVRDVYLHDCPSHGFLSNDSTSGSMLFSHVEVARCGGGLTHHSIYLTTGDDDAALANSVVQIEYSYIHDSTGGNDIKLRSKFNKVYYNWLETVPTGDYYDLHLIGPDDGTGGLVTNPRNSDVVGNVFIQRAPYAAVQIGGDGTGESFGQYRFVNNTFIVTGAQAPATWVRFHIRSLEFENNVFANLTGGGVTVFKELDGPNWVNTPRPLTGKANWVAAGSVVPSEFQSTIIGASNDPGFTDLAGLNLRPKTGSPLINMGTNTPVNPPGYTFPLPFALPTFEPPNRLAKQTADIRAANGPIDLGAYEASAPSAPTVGLSFNPASFYAGATTQVTYSLTNPNAVGLTGVAFTHNLPAQLKIASPAGLINSCGNGTVTATSNTSSVTVSGLTLTSNQTCSIKLQITSINLGSYNTATGPVSSNESGAGLASNSANVQVKAQAPLAAMSFNPTAILSGTTTVLSYTLTNPNPVGLSSVIFTDTLPAQLRIANPPSVTNTCGGTPTATAGGGQVSLSGASLAANANCVFSVSLTSGQLGTWLDQLESLGAAESGSASLTASASLQVVWPVYSASPVGAGNIIRIGAAKINTSRTMTLTVTNAGHPITSLGVTLTLQGPNSNLFNLSTPNLTLSGGQSSPVTISCTPTQSGLVTATLAVATNPVGLAPASYTLYCWGGSKVVTVNQDDGSQGTLSDALSTASTGDVVVFDLPANNHTITFSPAVTLEVKAGVVVDGGGCNAGPLITLDGTGASGDGLKLDGQNFIKDLLIKKFQGRQVVAAGGGNQLACVVASKN